MWMYKIASLVIIISDGGSFPKSYAKVFLNSTIQCRKRLKAKHVPYL